VLERRAFEKRIECLPHRHAATHARGAQCANDIGLEKDLQIRLSRQSLQGAAQELRGNVEDDAIPSGASSVLASAVVVRSAASANAAHLPQCPSRRMYPHLPRPARSTRLCE